VSEHQPIPTHVTDDGSQVTRDSGFPFIWPSSQSDRAWIVLCVLIAFAAALRIGLFDLNASVVTADGIRDLPNPFATVDHPFHAVRAETLRQSLADGQLLRWVGHHQGGYPVEFYPLGVAWLDIAGWLLLLGMVPIEAVHKLVVGAIFLLPGAAFLLMARRDGWSLGVGFMAYAMHLIVPGGWWHGGYTESVQWGLITNVAANVAMLLALPGIVTFIERGGRSWLLAVLPATFAIYANPRVLVSLLVIGVGAWLAVVIVQASKSDNRPSPKLAAGRLAAIGLMTAALTAPELFSLARFSTYYVFVRYQSYASVGEYLRNSAEAVTLPVLLLAIIGVGFGWTVPRRPVTRAVSVVLPLYAVGTMIVSERVGVGSVLQQLEATRLMPFQRYIVLYLAAVAFHRIARWVVGQFSSNRGSVADLLQVGAIAVAAIVVVEQGGAAPDPGVPPVPPNGLFQVETAASSTQAAFRDAVEVADDAAAPGTAILVIGSVVSWHQQLWAPLWTDRPMIYNDWLWNWNSWHTGPAGYERGGPHFYPFPELALDKTFLDRHGIGAVIVADTQATTSASAAAASSADLVEIASGLFAVYRVDAPTTIVTAANGTITDMTVGNERIAATVDGPAGPVTVRRTWYPRWSATVDGDAVSIARTDDGYMSIVIPSGISRVVLSYEVDGLDWFGRVIAIIGLVTVAGEIVSVRKRRWFPRRVRSMGRSGQRG